MGWQANRLATKVGAKLLADDGATAGGGNLATDNLMNFRGAWAATTVYDIRDVVTYNSGLYSAIAAFTSGSSFNAGNWNLIASPPTTITYGTTSGTSAQGNDSRIVNAIQKVTGGTSGHLAVLTGDGSVADGGAPATTIVPGSLGHRTLQATDTLVAYDSSNNDYYINPGDLAAYAATVLNARQTIAYGATIATNVALGRNIEVGTLTGNITVSNPTNPPEDGGTITYRFVQDSTGNRVVTWGTAFKGGSKTLSTAAGTVDRAVFQYRATSGTYEGSVVQNVGA